MRTRYQNLRSSTALVRPAPGSGLPGQFYVNMVDRIVGFFNDAGNPIDLAYLPLVGGSLSGFLTLHAPPTANLHAATKGYVDAGLAALDVDLTGDIAAAIATRLPLAGGTLSGFLNLHADPTANAHAANKGYVDTQVATRLTQAQANALYLQLVGGALSGFLTLHANPTANLHAAPKQYVDTQVATRLTQAQADALYLRLTGGTLTGALTLPGPPTQPLHAATKEFVEALIAATGAATHVGDTPPADPEQGQLWFKTIDPVGLYVWYIDADSSQWVSVGGGSGGGDGYNAPVGAVTYFAGNSAPNGWLVCNGQPVTSAFPDLRAFLLLQGSPFGVSGADPRVPDLRGEFIRGADLGRGVDPGRVFGSSQGDAIRNIVGKLRTGHGLNLFSQAGGTFSGALKPGSGQTGQTTAATALSGLSGEIELDASLAVPTAAENRPRNVALLPCIKAFSETLVEGQANFGIASAAQVIAGTSTDTLLTPANVRALQGEQSIAPTGLLSFVFDKIPNEANEIDLIFNGIGQPANGVIRFDWEGAPAARAFSSRVGVVSGVVPSVVGDDNNTQFVLDQTNTAWGVAGLIMLRRAGGRGGAWAVNGSLRRATNIMLLPTGIFNMNGEGNARLRFNSNLAYTSGLLTARWRI